MWPLAVLVIAFAPGLFWLWYFYQKDVYQPEPKRLVFTAFGLGAAAGVPAVILEFVLLKLTGVNARPELITLLSTGAVMLFIVGPVEEAVKYGAVRFSTLRSKYFDEPIDSFVYSSAAALGFASFENVFYALDLGWNVILVRGPITTLGHVLFAGIWGYALGRGMLYEATRRRFIFWLGASALAHGVFNILLLTHSWWGYAGTAALFTGLAWYLRDRMRWARGASPFKRNAFNLYHICPGCGHKVRPGAPTCKSCHMDLTPMTKPHAQTQE